ncbi:signal peptide peptidase-like 2b [Chrysochromulina tobinii]|uniref:Signal peptide peptidase-like 2b n=1 Tax=Chrysochromulina tobinii TaxID=1460289 RepID=A0A0M0JJZ8_9EUKA|nr:signal peptide peptidase-like 2b [Chrysochromulina tobinii]|eukprot:KOO26815.1 signal peptide peptidase-like 2b [Chrysochromulina sp. CCMP291]
MRALHPSNPRPPISLPSSREAASARSRPKIRTALAVGASVLIVADTLTTLYAPLPNDTSSSLLLADPCSVYCDAGRGMVDTRGVEMPDVLSGLVGQCPPPDTYSGKRCSTNLCAFSSFPNSSSPMREVCCVLEPHMPPVAAPAATFSVPVLSISLALGMVLERMCSTSTFSVSGLLSRCSLQVTIETDVPRGAWDGAWDGSAPIIWAIATGTAALASYLAASEHKMQDQEMRAALRDNKRSPDLAADLASVAASTIDTTTAVAFLVMASASLLTLYFLLQVGLASVLLFLINLAFILVSAAASAEVFLLPLLMTLCPSDLQEASIRLSRAAVTSAAPDAASACAETAVPAEATRTAPPAAEDSEALQLLPLVSSLTALAISISWFIYRKEPWMWLVQDGLSMAVCILFVRTIRLPSLKLATFFLCLMFLYDICMVFISPLVFHKSVMLEVATAGASTRSIVYDGVFSPPPPLLPPLAAEEALGVGSWLWRLSGAPGDYGMIGLGDIVLPALAIAYGRRVDLASAPNAWFGYYTFAVVGYAVGLLVTLAANAYGWTFNGVQGQPALLYLVPGVIGFQLLRAVIACELQATWEGQQLPQLPANLSSLSCDGCNTSLLLDEMAHSDSDRNLDYCRACFARLPAEKRRDLVERPVHERCGVDLPTAIKCTTSTHRDFAASGGREQTLL